MSVKYVAVRWNSTKRLYDALILGGILLYVLIFWLIGTLTGAGDDVVLLIRALGTCAFLLLNIVLCIGPLARLDRRFLPLLYNRRHLGIATFLVAFAHAACAVGYYDGFGRVNPLVSLLSSNVNFGSWTAFPFEVLGLIALTILSLMAATSHDFWQKNLGASVWKGLHMLVYPAYALVVMHVILGALQSETSPVYPALLALAVAVVTGLHIWTGCREVRRDVRGFRSVGPWVDVGALDEIPEERAKTVCLAGGERVAVFRYDGKVAAVTNACAHQRGPLGEGKIVDGCITCPWHGWQYQPEDGRSPPPFEETIATFSVRIENQRVLLDPRPLPLGTATAPAQIERDV